jgi:hypothetical protein
VDDLIELIGAVDQILQAQSEADSQYFLRLSGGSFNPEEVEKIKTRFLKAYRWQYIVSGVEQPRFMTILRGFITEAQGHRIREALAPIL